MAKNHLKYLTNPKEEIPRKIRRTLVSAKLYLDRLKLKFGDDYTDEILPYNWQGKPKRYELINKIIKHKNFRDYLEIGCFRDECFGQIVAENKVGVDPMSGGTIRMTSDDFFAQNSQKFDFIFIDGLHTYEQVEKDIKNSLKCLNEGGVIALHDCMPLSFYSQCVPPVNNIWNGDVWKAIVEARSLPEIDTTICLIDHGVGVMVKRPNRKILDLGNIKFKELKFKDFAKNHKEWFEPIEFEEVLNFVDKI